MADPLTHYAPSTKGLVGDVQSWIACGTLHWGLVSDDPQQVTCEECRKAAHTPLTLDELLKAVEIVDAHIDAATSPAYRAQPLAADWARVTKVCEEAGEVWRALSKLTGENPRKGVCGTEDDLLGELGDTVSAGICAIQHRTKDTGRTWAVVSAALIKARQRVAEYAPAREAGSDAPPA